MLVKSYNSAFLFYFQKHNKYKKFLRQSDIDRDQSLKTRCDALMTRIQNFNLNSSVESPKTCKAVKTPQKTSIVEEQVSIYIYICWVYLVAYFREGFLRSNPHPPEHHNKHSNEVLMIFFFVQNSLPKNIENTSLSLSIK